MVPEAPEPDNLLSEQELSKRYLDKLPEHIFQAVPDAMRDRALAERPIEMVSNILRCQI